MTAPGDEVPSRAWIPVACAVLTGAQVGASIVATRAVTEHLDPVPMTFVRYLIGSCVLVPIAWRLMRRPMPPRDLVMIAGLGLLQFGLLIVLLTIGLQTVPAAQGSLIFSTSPVFATVLAIGFGQERPSIRRIAGIALALGGLALALWPNLRGEESGSVSGWLLIAASALCAAIAGVWSRPMVRRYGAVLVSAIAMVATALTLLVPTVVQGGLGEIRSMPLNAAFWLVMLGFGSGVGYLLWLEALGWLGASTVTTFLTLAPPTALVLGAAFLGEPLTIWTMAGMGVVGAGLVVIARVRTSVAIVPAE